MNSPDDIRKARLSDSARPRLRSFVNTQIRGSDAASSVATDAVASVDPSSTRINSHWRQVCLRRLSTAERRVDAPLYTARRMETGVGFTASESGEHSPVGGFCQSMTGSSK